jgi:hypothetical protein
VWVTTRHIYTAVTGGGQGLPTARSADGLLLGAAIAANQNLRRVDRQPERCRRCPACWIMDPLIPHGRGRPAPPSKALLGLMRRAHRIEGHVAGLQRKHGAPAHTAHVEPRAVAGAEDATYVRMRST